MIKQVVFYFFIGLFLSSSIHAKPIQNPAYTMIIDAGSTGSRIHLFEYYMQFNIPVIHELFSESSKPGLASYENMPEAAGSSLKKLIEDALLEAQKKQLDPAKIRINLYGTAGMRLIAPEKQAAIYQQVSLFIKNNYSLIPGEIKTIPGNLEGLFGWLDLNYLLKSFDSPVDITQGSIDVGGSSIEIAFSTLANTNSSDYFRLFIGGQAYTIYSKSFLGLGLSEALHHINMQPLAESCYPKHYALNSTQQGNFNFESCKNLYVDLIKQHAVQQELPSLANKNFVAYSGAYHTENFFDVAQKPSQENLLAHIQT
ncbi:MAG TPA: hypothetical protein VLH77_04705, partial [Gammaproteobacteria bacterium]|nr:hypothetical protein [Gammaproteobacteria bacterium]